MTNGREFDKPGVYQIRVKATLDEGWSSWFAGWTIAPQPDGTTLLAGKVSDQLGLHGTLSTIRDLGLLLLSVEKVEDDPPTEGRSKEG